MMKRRGKQVRSAHYALMYGASVKRATKTSGLSIRRVKTLQKKLEL